MIKDSNIAFKTKKINRDFRYMYGMLNGTGQGTGAPATAAHSVAASEQTVVPVGATGDEFYDVFMLPWDIDITKPLRWRLIFSHQSTDQDTPTFTFDYMARAAGEAVADITSHESTTFSGAVASGANLVEVTDWVSTSSQSYITSSDSMLFTRVTCTNSGGADPGEIEMIALQLEYTIQATASDNRRHTTDFEPV